MNTKQTVITVKALQYMSMVVIIHNFESWKRQQEAHLKQQTLHINNNHSNNQYKAQVI